MKKDCGVWWKAGNCFVWSKMRSREVGDAVKMDCEFWMESEDGERSLARERDLPS